MQNVRVVALTVLIWLCESFRGRDVFGQNVSIEIVSRYYKTYPIVLKSLLSTLNIQLIRLFYDLLF